MAIISETLKNISVKVESLLIEMYPNLSEAIAFHAIENQKEWFAMLFTLHKWQASSAVIDQNTIHTQEYREAAVLKEIEGYSDVDYGYITVVLMEGEYHLVDGYHRVFIARQEGVDKLKAVVWEKKPNNHPNCQKIKDLILKNL